MNDTAVQIHNVTKTYGSKKALDHLELSIPSNRITAIMGPNGSGKSTLFRLIMGLTIPDQGTIHVLGQPPGWRANAQIVYLPDRARWYERHTVNLALDWGEKLLPGFNRSQAEALIEFMDLDRDMPVSGMSKGQEARLMLLMCLSRDVPLIILDEPFSGIDIISRERIVEALINRISSQEQTIVISTHEIADAEGLFEHAVFLEQGQVRVSGEVEQLRSQYGSMEMKYRQIYR